MADSPLTIGEKAFFDYILAAFPADTEDTEAFRDELPGDFNTDNERIWTAFFEGGGEPDDTSQTVNQSCAINGRGVFEGGFVNKADAQTYACKLKTIFNTDQITNVSYCRMVPDPKIERGVMNRDPELTTSGEARVWVLTVEFEMGIDYK